MSDSVWPHRRQPTSLLCPRDSPGKNTGVGCHFLLQWMKVKSESEVAQSCLTLSDSMDWSLPSFVQLISLFWYIIIKVHIWFRFSYFYLCPFSVSRSHSRTHVKFTCSITLGSSWQGEFVRLSLISITLIVLRILNYSTVCPTIGIYLVFFSWLHWDDGFWGGRE